MPEYRPEGQYLVAELASAIEDREAKVIYLETLEILGSDPKSKLATTMDLAELAERITSIRAQLAKYRVDSD